MTSNSKVNEALLKVQAQIRLKQHRVGVMKLAEALCYALRIPEGREMVMLLTPDSTLRSNREAVAAWVESQLADPSMELSPQVTPIFVDLLRRKLLSLHEGESA